MTRVNARRAFRFSATRGRKYMDFFCLSPNGIRVGYASPKLLRTLSRRLQRALRNRVVVALTANPRYSLGAVRAGMRLGVARRHLRIGRAYKIGLNTWYVVSRRGANGILKVRRGVVEEIGIADRRVTTGRRGQLRFLKSFF